MKRGRNGNGNGRPVKRARTINTNAANILANKRRTVTNRALLRSRVYQTLLAHYRYRSYNNIKAAVNRALTQAGM